MFRLAFRASALAFGPTLPRSVLSAVVVPIYNHQGTRRGDDHASPIDRGMITASRPAGADAWRRG